MTRKAILLAGAATCAVSFAAFANFSTPKGAAFIDPVLMKRTMCGAEQAPISRRAFFLRAAAAYAQEGDETEASKVRPDTLMAITYDAGSDVEGVQEAFDHGLAYLYNFNHAAAVAAFREAQAADPDCSLCHWGEAFALGSNINAPATEEALAPAREAALRAAETAKPGTLEEDLARAVLARYPEVGGVTQEDGEAFADAMDMAAKDHPQNDFVAVLAAEANMDTQAWDYWQASGRLPKGRTARTVELIEGVLARNPDYPPAIHLYIHITEASTNPHRAKPHADRLADLAPDLGHLVHMPTHTYFVLGEWKETMDLNLRAIEADETYLAQTDVPSPFVQYGYYPHNVHFALSAAQMGGHGELAQELAAKLDAALPAEMASAAGWMQAIKAAPYYVAVQFGAPEDVLAMAPPPADMPYLVAAWHYARGEHLARMGEAAGAEEEAAAIRRLTDHEGIDALEAQFMPARSVLEVSALTVEARAAAESGDLASAIALMEEAADLQAEMPYMEPPWWYYPSTQTLAAYLLMDGQNERAEKLFQTTLLRTPNNAYALYGLRETYAAMNDRLSRRYAGKLYGDAWMGPRRQTPVLARL